MLNHYNRAMGPNPEDLVYYLLPVDATYTPIQSGYGSTFNSLTDLKNQMWPTAAMLDKKDGNLKIEMIFSDY